MLDDSRIEEYKSLMNIIRIINNRSVSPKNYPNQPLSGEPTKLQENIVKVMECIDLAHYVLEKCCNSAIEIEQTVRTRNIQRGFRETTNKQPDPQPEPPQPEPEPLQPEPPQPEPQQPEPELEEEAPIKLSSNSKFLKRLYKAIALKCHPDKTNDTLLTEIFPYLSESKNDIRIIGLMYLIGWLNLDVYVDVNKYDEKLIKSCNSKKMFVM